MKKITLTHSSMNVMILGNFDVQQTSYIPGFAHTGTWYDFFTGQPFEVTDLAESMSFEAGEYRLFTDVQLPTPQIGTGIVSFPGGGSTLHVYPNPSDHFNVEISLESSSSVNLEVYDITGQLVDNVFTGKLSAGLHQFRWSGSESGLARGVYFIQMVTAEESIACKLLSR
jgi:hypothetical protein